MRTLVLLLLAAILTVIFLLVLAALSPRASARDDGQWRDQPPEIHQWFQSVMRPGFEEPPRYSGHSCCGEGDAFDVALDGEEPNGSIRAILLNGRGIFPDGKLFIVPRDKIQAKYGNPLDKIILFIAINGLPICLIPKVGA